MSDSVAVGMHAVKVLLQNKPDKVTHLLLAGGRKDKKTAALRELASKVNVRVEQADIQKLDALAQGARHQGVVAFLAQAASQNEDSLYDLLDDLEEAPFLLILDGVTDPHNLGACLRSADAAGAHAVIVPKDNSCGLTPVVRKVASGAADTVPLIQVTNLARTLDELKARGIWLTGTSDQSEQSVYDLDFTGPLGLVLGAEGDGMRRLTTERCDYLAVIPMAGSVESLNVSVAAGICLFEAVRQRRAV